MVIKQNNGKFVTTKTKELSTHIAKLYSEEFPEIIELEYLSSLAVKSLLPDDDVCEMEIGYLDESKTTALFIERFDRGSNNERIHFEEFNSLLNKMTDYKYDASYDDIGRFILGSTSCQNKPKMCLQIYKRILANVLIGNTDAHLKNFAMFHCNRLLFPTPMYDLVCSSFYPKFKELALKINKQKYDINNVKPKILVQLGTDAFGLNYDQITMAFKSLEQQLEITIQNLENCQLSNTTNLDTTKKGLISVIKKRWNGNFKHFETAINNKKKINNKMDGLNC